MEVTDALIDKLARLSMLQFSEGEREEIRNDLQKMIGFVDKLKELDTTGVEPLLYLSDARNVLREDAVGDVLPRQEALRNAPMHDGVYFKVPQVIQKPSQS
ncbi:MAG TPA: Asp-tRNA(Asn)/Glu-tRNA(Gln) amidotransferase subunit GatC [Flavisolibacter sp.]|jgi:aspartyl-tRNA(Asn)/glutamyl-tRNA(Gln) amidotransferase subunit C